MVYLLYQKQKMQIMNQGLTNEGQELWNNMDNEVYIDKLSNTINKKVNKLKKTTLSAGKLIERINIEILKCEHEIALNKLKVEHWTKSEQYYKAHEARTICTMYSIFKKVFEDILIPVLPIKEVDFEIIEELDDDNILSQTYIE